MSVRVMSVVFESDMPPTERLVMLALADHADDAGDCYPSVARLVDRTGLSERAVRAAFRKLEDAGALEIRVGAGPAGCNRFRLKPAAYAPTPCNTCTPAPDAPLHDVQPPPAPRAPEPSLNHHVEPKGSTRATKQRQVREHLERVLSPMVADDFIAHRTAIRKPLTPQAAKLIAKQLEGHFDPDEVACVSIRNGWAGVFPDNVKPSASKPDLWAMMQSIGEDMR